MSRTASALSAGPPQAEVGDMYTFIPVNLGSTPRPVACLLTWSLPLGSSTG